tara:strand:+ start:270 stop:545 length:276 start_codon:yes stop_codon:yes gene_type:complete
MGLQWCGIDRAARTDPTLASVSPLPLMALAIPGTRITTTTTVRAKWQFAAWHKCGRAGAADQTVTFDPEFSIACECHKGLIGIMMNMPARA